MHDLVSMWRRTGVRGNLSYHPMLRVAVRREVLRYLYSPGGQMSTISAERTGLPNVEQASRNRELLSELQKGGWPHESATGIYGGSPENSVLVFGIPFGNALQLMARFGQDSIIYKARGESRPWMYNHPDGTKTPGVDLLFGEHEAPLTDRTQFRRDPAQQFTLDFDWDHPEKWSLPGNLIPVWEDAREKEEEVKTKQKEVVPPKHKPGKHWLELQRMLSEEEVA